MSTDRSIDDPFLPVAFSLFSNPGAYAVLAGAGVSRGAGLPTAWDIVVDLVAQIAGGDELITAQTAAPWYEAKFGLTPTYSEVVHRLALTPTERQGLLRKYFEPTTDDETGGSQFGPSDAHRAVARLMRSGVIPVVVTMNFDRLFEQALRELQIEPTVVATDSDARGLAPLHTVQHCIIHLHGDYLNATSMKNTTAELSGYSRNMKALLTRVISEYGLLVAGWSVEHDHALREAVSAHHRSLFTMGWVSPRELSGAAAELANSKRALVLETTADDAFGHLADQVEAMRDRRARHPLSLPIAVNRIKRELSGRSQAISAHDMLAAEFTRLRTQPAFHLDRFMDGSTFQPLLRQVVEASRIPAGCVAALAYWGNDGTDRWWIPELVRFARPFVRASGLTALLDLPLVVGSTLFYTAGVVAVTAERFDLLARLFALRGNKSGGPTGSLASVLAPGGLVDVPVVPHYEEVANLVQESLGLGVEPVDDAIQAFEVMRLCWEVIGGEGFSDNLEAYALRRREVESAATLDLEQQNAAAIAHDKALGRIAEQCSPYSAHILAAEVTVEAYAGRRWRSPVAEQLGDDVARMGEDHPLAIGWKADSNALSVALQAVSKAVGRYGRQLELGFSGWMPEQIWLDTGQPPDRR